MPSSDENNVSSLPFGDVAAWACDWRLTPRLCLLGRLTVLGLALGLTLSLPWALV